jgi:2-hydroxychromene-2-carboxylate isomerase
MKTIDYYFNPLSVWTYMGHKRFEEIARRYGAAIAYKPADFGRIFSVSGGVPVPQRAKQRQIYRLAEIERFSKYLKIPVVLEPKYYPVPSDIACRIIIVAPESKRGDVAHALMRACWSEERNISDRATQLAILNDLGLDGNAVIAAAEAEDAKKQFEAITQEAIDRNVFGAPTYIVDGDLFWGQDRLDFVERKLAGQG